MPSGSHGGHSGSHGGSHSSSHRSSSSRRSGSYRPRRPIYFRVWHTRYMVRSGASAFVSFLGVLLFFAIFGFVASWIMKSQSEGYLREIEADYVYYQNMIVDAKENPEELIVDGTVITKFYNSVADKWYITYFFIDDNGEMVEGYTFSVYTLEQVNNFQHGDTIKLAVDGRPMDSMTDSIPLDYAEMPIEQDGEYATFSSEIKGERIAMIVCGSAVGGIIALSIVIMLTNKVKVNEEELKSQRKKEMEETKKAFEHFNKTVKEVEERRKRISEDLKRIKADIDKNEANNDEDEQTDIIEEEIKTSQQTYCDYCGAEISPDEIRCPNCKSKLKI